MSKQPQPHTEFGPESSPPLPWTAEQVEALNRFQQSGRFHPFTCGNRLSESHRQYARDHGGDVGQLVATTDGWICPVCDYTQDWAHGAMMLNDIQDELNKGHR